MKNRSKLITLLLATTFPIILNAQNIHPGAKDFKKKQLKVTKDKDKVFKDQTSVFYLCFTYDFADSISIYDATKEIYTGKLEYVIPENDVSYYPFNRKMIKVNVGKPRATYKIIFWKTATAVAVPMRRKFHFYNFGLIREAPTWYLTLTNFYPWPN